MQIPEHIEKYLTEAGLAGTEVLIIKNLIGGDTYTLRELASRTGKSTGVLDQASKKLIRRGIVKRIVINNTPKIGLSSLDGILKWIRQDIGEKQNILERKADDFESFLNSAQIHSDQPNVHLFEKLEGIESAYELILEKRNIEWLCFLPSTTEQDPPDAFKKEIAKKRKERNIYARIITNNSPLGRRIRSRDPFDKQKTTLVPSGISCPFERIICGETIVCFDHSKQRGFVIKNKSIANAERHTFELLSGLAIEPHSYATHTPISIPRGVIKWKPFFSITPSWVRDLLKGLRIIPSGYVINKDSHLYVIDVFVQDQPGLMFDLTKVFAIRGINISRFGVYTLPPEGGLHEIHFEAHDQEEAEFVLAELRSVPGVIDVLKR